MPYFLAFDGGGTATQAGLYDATGACLAETTGESTNPVERDVAGCLGTLVRMATALLHDRDTPLEMIVAAVSGASKGELAAALREGLLARLDARAVLVTNDLVPLIRANLGLAAGSVVVAGTGSSLAVQTDHGGIRTFGGRGRVLGEPGSAYQLVETVLRAAAKEFDVTGATGRLGARLLEKSNHESLDAMSMWLAHASKTDVAALARVVVAAAESGDAEARTFIVHEARALAEFVLGVLRRESIPAQSPLLIHGGMFRASAAFREAFESTVREGGSAVAAREPSRTGHVAAIALGLHSELRAGLSVRERAAASTSSTEQHSADGTAIDQLPVHDMTLRMAREDRRAAEAVAAAADDIAQVIEATATAFQSGGRLIYVGAGTSGRLGVLDAAECPPTFGVPPDRVLAVMAGGEEALRRSIEGAEDDRDQAVTDIRAIAPPVGQHDIVVGITASGSTPYVVAVLAEARRTGAKTAIICCNPPRDAVADWVVYLDTGPEVLAGSTRLKAGTATKMALNQLSTGAMALSGRVYRGYMVGVQPQNAKLRKRAAGIVAALTQRDNAAAASLLNDAGNDIAVAVIMAKLGVDAADARRRLDATRGSIREVLGE